MTLLGEDWSTLAVVLAGALAGGFVNGLTGFGTGLTALPFWLQVLDPLIAAQVAAGSAVVSQFTTLPGLREEVDLRRLAPPLLAGVAAVPVGLMLVPYVSSSTSKLTVGLVLIVYCTVMLVAAGRIKLTAGGRGAETVVGFAGGVLGGVAGVPAPPVAMWVTLRTYSMQERRVLLQTFNVAVLSAMLAFSLLAGLLGTRFLAALAVALPGSLCGAVLGWLVYRRLDDHRFDRIVLVFLLLSGFALVWPAR
jgi:uncharacterized protein